MAFLSFIYQKGLWISVPALVASAVLLGFFIRRVIRVVRRAHLLDVPLVEQQEIAFGEAGRIVLCIQGPHLSSRFANLHYELIGPDGMPIQDRRNLFPLRTSGLTRVRMTERSYKIPQPGHYIFQIKGLGPGGTADSDHRIVFMKPHLASSIGCVIGIVLAGFLLIGSAVLFLSRLLE
jgi:hypothetical protein